MANKIKYGLSNVYFAPITAQEANGSVTFGEPVAWPGAVSLSMDQEGEISNFYADNVVYWSGAANNGYSGTLESALVPESFRTQILGEIKNTDGVLLEDAGATGAHFALLFQFEGDEKATRHVLYNCVASRPSQNGNTKEESIDPETETVDIEAATIFVPALSKNLVKARTGDEATDTVYNGWFTAVYVPTAGEDTEGA